MRKPRPTRHGSNGQHPRGLAKGHFNGNARAHGNGGVVIRSRGNPQQAMERYLALARDALSLGDRITAEGYFQHAEHYYRVMTENDRDHG